MDIKIIAMDLDGTLTNEKKEITPKTIDTLMKAQQKGLRLILASGRPPYGMRPLAKLLRMEEYGGIILCYNGGHVEESANGNILVELPLDEKLIPQLVKFQNESLLRRTQAQAERQAQGKPDTKYPMTLMTYYEDTIYTMDPENKYVNISAFNNKMKVKGVKDFVNETPRPVNKCLMVGDPEIVPYWEKRMQDAMKGKMHILRSTPYFIELLPLGIDKGPSLVRMLEQINVTEGLATPLTPENMMAFGDSYNDIEMLRLAGIGVAMGNAEDKVKEVADYVTDDNDHDGIATALEHFGLV